MINRINPLYLILLCLTIVFISITYVNSIKSAMNKSNKNIDFFQQNLNEYLFYNSKRYSNNKKIEKIKQLLKNELLLTKNINVKTLKEHINIKISSKNMNVKIALLRIFNSSKLNIDQINISDENIQIKVKYNDK